MTDIMKKQYVIAATDLEISAARRYALEGGYHLYAGDGLRLRELVDKTGRKYLLLGEAFCTDSFPKSVEEAVAAYDGGDVLELIRPWTGRFLLIAGAEIYRDATGLMGAFLCDNILSSSCAALQSLTDVGQRYPAEDSGLTWNLLPGGAAEKISAVYPTEKIRLSPEKILRENLMWVQDKRNLTTQEKAKALAEMLKNAIGNMERFSGRKLLIALTAGKDSRLVLSAALASGVAFETYTAEHGDITYADIKIPKKMAKMFGFSHSYIKKRKLSPKLLEDYDRFTCQNANGADRMFCGYGQFRKLPQDALVIRSGLFEAGQVYGRKISKPGDSGFASGFATYYKTSLKNENQRRNFQNWQAYTEENSCDFVDIRDRFYLEQRIGGWASAIEQSMDMQDFLSLQIANSMDILSLLLSADERERKNLALSYDTMCYLKPEVLSFPVNSKSVLDYLPRIKRKLMQIGKRLNIR